MAEAAAKPRSQAAVAGLFLDKALRHWLVVLGIAAVALILGYIGLDQLKRANLAQAAISVPSSRPSTVP